MARWKLACSHYLNVPDNEWEYQEQSRTKGKPIRRRFPVPRLLDINDPGDWTNTWGPNDAAEGEIIVCHEDKGNPTDITFFGDPTPDMVPVDDEARAISATFEERWKYKPESAEVSFSQTLVDEFEEAMSNVQAKPVEIPGLQELATAVAIMAQQNGEILKTIAESAVRRI